jgi:hypothetical protein
MIRDVTVLAGAGLGEGGSGEGGGGRGQGEGTAQAFRGGHMLSTGRVVSASVAARTTGEAS